MARPLTRSAGRRGGRRDATAYRRGSPGRRQARPPVLHPRARQERGCHDSCMPARNRHARSKAGRKPCGACPSRPWVRPEEGQVLRRQHAQAGRNRQRADQGRSPLDREKALAHVGCSDVVSPIKIALPSFRLAANPNGARMSARAQFAVQGGPEEWAQFMRYDGYASHMLPALVRWTLEGILAAREIRQVRAEERGCVDPAPRPRSCRVRPANSATRKSGPPVCPAGW